MNSKDNILFEKNVGRMDSHDRSPHSEERLFPINAECCELSVACSRSDYSASRISRAVEDADAHLLNLNVTSETLPTGEVIIDLRVSHRNAGAVSRSLDRYGYQTVAIRSGYDTMQQEMAERIGELMAHIEV